LLLKRSRCAILVFNIKITHERDAHSFVGNIYIFNFTFNIYFMKNLLLLLAFASMLWVACNFSSQQKQLANEVKISASQRASLPNLAYFQNFPNSSVVEAPSGYTPQMAGIWEYSKVYLFTQNGSGRVIELYAFASQAALDRAEPEMKCDKYEEDGEIWCGGTGGTCVCKGADLPGIALSMD